MLLEDLLKGIEIVRADRTTGIDITDIASDSRAVTKGSLFIAVNGYSLDGRKFISEAISKGAKAIVTDIDLAPISEVVRIKTTDARDSLSKIGANFYRHPSRSLKMIGVTGTNGKTTITYLIEHMLRSAGRKPGVIGTINYRFGDKTLTAKNTTPGSLELNRLLAEMAAAGIDSVAMEVSSHSLDQRRIDGIEFDIAIFTNITSDHLDYHKTVENYLDAKSKLFQYLKGDGIAILNNDDKKVAGLKPSIKAKRIFSYGLENGADIKAEDVRLSLKGSSFIAATAKGDIKINTSLIGRHNVSNILAAISAGLAMGLAKPTIGKALSSFKSVPGRLERIEEGQPFQVFVDYAHTEDALHNILSLLKEVATRKLITVFGCGGDRDRSKRPLMGRMACRYSDTVIMTSDNPRFEEPRDILRDIEKGIKDFTNYEIVEDRLKAIEKALSLAGKDDIVVIAGKGHEKYQIIKDKTVPFDDCEAARAFLRRR